MTDQLTTWWTATKDTLFGLSQPSSDSLDTFVEVMFENQPSRRQACSVYLKFKTKLVTPVQTGFLCFHLQGLQGGSDLRCMA